MSRDTKITIAAAVLAALGFWYVRQNSERLRVACENMHCPAPFKPKFKVEHGGHCACDVEPTKEPLP